MTFDGYPVFPFRIDHTRNINVRWLNDPMQKHLSPAPKGFLDGLQTVRKRRLQVSVLVAGDQISEIESFLADIGTQAFWLPDLPRDLEVASHAGGTAIDVAAGNVAAFFDAGMAYAVTALPQSGNNPLMARVENVAPEGAGYRLTLAGSLPELSSTTHEIGLAVLVSLNAETITFSPITPQLWEVTLELTEQPAELGSPQQERIIYFRYIFSAVDHLDTSLEHRYTTAATADGNFEPFDIIHSDLTYGLVSGDNECTVSLQAMENGPFAGWSPLYLGPPLKLTVEKKEIKGGEETVTKLFHGQCVEVSRQGSEIEARFVPQLIKGRIPNFFASPRDNFDPWRTHTLANFSHEVSLISKLNNRVIVTWNGTDPSVLEGGFVVYVPETGLAEVRDILKSTGINSDTAAELRISFSASAPLADERLTVYEKYDGSPQDYIAKFGSIAGFGGHPRITTVNPSFKGLELKQGTGKK